MLFARALIVLLGVYIYVWLYSILLMTILETSDY